MFESLKKSLSQFYCPLKSSLIGLITVWVSWLPTPLCNESDVLRFFNSIHLLYLALCCEPSVQSSYCCFELFQVLMKIFSSSKMSSDKSSKPNYTWKYFSFYVINNQNISVFNKTCFDSCPVRMRYSTHNEFSQDTLLPGATWKEVLTLLHH